MTNMNLSLSQNKHAILFVPTDYVGMATVSKVVPALIAQGITPVLFNTGSNKNRKFKVQPQPDISFYNVGALERVVIPFVRAASLNRSENKAEIRTYEQLASDHALQLHVIQDVNAQTTRDIINYIPNLMGAISIRQLMVFESETIDLLRSKGFFWNLHSGLLPEYKGLLIPYHAIAKGEKSYGWTLHEIFAGIDTGPIIATCSNDLDPSKPVLETYLEMVPKAVDMIAQSIGIFEAGRINQQKTPNMGGSYYSYPTSEQIKVLSQQGVRYVASADAFADRLAGHFTPAANPFQTQRLRAEILRAHAHLMPANTNVEPALKARVA